MSQTKVQEKAYSYFDTPDGHDVYKKLWCVLKPTIPAAAGFAVCDVVLWSYPKGYTATAARFAGVSLPLVGIASTFVLATNGLASLRQKDDRLNWVLGGFITGSCFGIWGRSRMLGFNMGMFGAILGWLRKEAQINGVLTLTPPIKHFKGGATSTDRDYSLTAERPRNWVTKLP